MDLSNTPGSLGIPERIRRSQGRLARNAIASAKVTQSEQAELEAAARREGKALSEWAREALLEKARSNQTDTTLFTEVIALRMLMSTVLRSVALGERLSPEAYAQVLAEVRANKHETARDVLTQYQTQAGGR
jgi:hypothetical protein